MWFLSMLGLRPAICYVYRQSLFDFIFWFFMWFFLLLFHFHFLSHRLGYVLWIPIFSIVDLKIIMKGNLQFHSNRKKNWIKCVWNGNDFVCSSILQWFFFFIFLAFAIPCIIHCFSNILLRLEWSFSIWCRRTSFIIRAKKKKITHKISFRYGNQQPVGWIN